MTGLHQLWKYSLEEETDLGSPSKIKWVLLLPWAHPQPAAGPGGSAGSAVGTARTQGCVTVLTGQLAVCHEFHWKSLCSSELKDLEHYCLDIPKLLICGLSLRVYLKLSRLLKGKLTCLVHSFYSQGWPGINPVFPSSVLVWILEVYSSYFCAFSMVAISEINWCKKRLVIS